MTRRARRGIWLLIDDGAAATAVAEALARGAARRSFRAPFERLRFAQGEILRPLPSRAMPDAARLSRLAARYGVQGALVVLRPGGEADLPTGILEALATACPGLSVCLVLIEESLAGDGAVLGGRGESLEAVLEHVAEAAAGQALAAAADGVPDDTGPAAARLLLPGDLLRREPAWRAAAGHVLSRMPAARFVALYVLGREAVAQGAEADIRRVLDDILGRQRAAWTAAPAPGRRVAVAAVATLLVACLVVVLATVWRVGDLERRLARHAEVMMYGLASPELSPPALAALGALVGVIDRGEARLPLVPASWSGDLEALLTRRVAEQIGPLLVEPVRRRLAAEHAQLAAAIGRPDAGSAVMPAEELATVAAHLKRAAALAEQTRRFRLAADGSLRQQWEPLATWSGGVPVALDWLDTGTGHRLLAAALSRTDWEPPALGPLAERVLAALEHRLAAAGHPSAQAVADARRAAAAPALAGTGGTDAFWQAVDRLQGDLTAVAVWAEREAEVLSRTTAAASALRALERETVAAGLADEVRWRRIATFLDRYLRTRRQYLETQSLPGIGPVFARPDGTVPALVPSPRLLAARDALAALAHGSFARRPSLPPPDFGALAMQEGPPNRRLVAAAVRRLHLYHHWVATHWSQASGALPERLLRVVESQTAEAAVLELGAAYGTGIPAPGPDPVDGAAVAADLAEVIDALSAMNHRWLADVTWLVGVRTYRELEALDAQYEAGNLFRFAGVVAGWNGRDAVLHAADWRSEDDRRRHFHAGLERLRALTHQAAPLLEVLATPAVAGSLDHPRLVAKWTWLVEVAAAPERAEGYRALRTYVLGTLADFRSSDCTRQDRLPSVSGLPADEPFVQELEAIKAALIRRCGTFLRVPPPRRKPVPMLPTPKQIRW